jgi:hypothetical protein
MCKQPLLGNSAVETFLYRQRENKTYASPAWEFAADTHLLKLQRLQNKVLCTIGNFPRRTPV